KVRDDALGLLELPNVGLAVTDALAKRFGSDRERAEAVLIAEARDLPGGPPLPARHPGEGRPPRVGLRPPLRRAPPAAPGGCESREGLSRLIPQPGER